ncbi:MAG TPA: DNA-formamidopyrimidine glycosylase family protein [Acidimicrobiia bacterium]|nr:DNA-formamidopyrimidine glycosylase family protein [Acidimicrobiia bacterium]
MPEGDSYVRAADRARPVLIGNEITDVGGSAPEIRARSEALIGATATDVRTQGKHLLIDVDSGYTIHIHLGMPGRVRTTSPGGRPGADPGAVRLALTTAVGTMWVIAAPTVEVRRRKVVEKDLEQIGPDVLAAEFDWERYEEMASRYPAERTVSDFLLDQRVMAGIGNVYKCEVLFLEGIDPRRSMSAVDMETRTALARRARRLMMPNAGRSVRSTIGRPGGGTWVYKRAGKPCRRCGTAIDEGWVGEPARLTYWCPTCQPAEVA